MPKGCPRHPSAWLGPFHAPAVAFAPDRRVPRAHAGSNRL